MRRLSRKGLRRHLERTLSTGRYKVIIFDLNGIFGGYSRALFILNILRSKGIVFAIWCVYRFLALKEKCDELLCGKCCEHDYWERFLESWPRILKKIEAEDMESLLSKSIRPIDRDMVELLEELKRDYKIDVVALSDINGKRINELGEDTEYGLLLTMFDQAFYSCDIGYTKISSGSFTHVLRSIGRESATVIFVDDHRGNVKLARRVGINAICLKPSRRRRKTR